MPDMTVPAIVPTIMPPYVRDTMKLRSFNGTHEDSRAKHAGNIGPWAIPINTRIAINECAPPRKYLSNSIYTMVDMDK